MNRFDAAVARLLAQIVRNNPNDEAHDVHVVTAAWTDELIVEVDRHQFVIDGPLREALVDMPADLAREKLRELVPA